MTMRIYRGCIIQRNDQPGYALPWSSYVNGLFVYADSLSGVKQLIRENVK